jgi:ferredoxin-type protein NapG
MTACEPGALQVIPITQAVMGTAILDRDTCAAWRGTPCDKCYRACPVREDTVLIAPDGRVFIDPRTCIGCGMCRAACPTNPVSIEIEPPSRF